MIPMEIFTKKELSIKDFIKQMRAKFGEDAIMHLDETPPAVEVISTGSLTLDNALLVSGLPKGKITEVFGYEATGKTTLALSVIKECQKQGGNALYIDAEQGLNLERVAQLGIDFSRFVVNQPNCGEEAIEILEEAVRSRKFAVIVIDSVAALTPKSEIEGEVGAAQMGSQARLIGHAMRKLISLINESGSVVLFINQIRQSLAAAWGDPNVTPGGKALKFYAWVRLEVKKTKSDNKNLNGQRVKVKVIKNKCAPPFGEASFDIMYDTGISKSGEVLELFEEKLLKSSTYSWHDVKIGVGFENARASLAGNPTLLDDIIKSLNNKQ